MFSQYTQKLKYHIKLPQVTPEISECKTTDFILLVVLFREV
jgi:hypothetical protein